MCKCHPLSLTQQQNCSCTHPLERMCIFIHQLSSTDQALSSLSSSIFFSKAALHTGSYKLPQHKTNDDFINFFYKRCLQRHVHHWSGLIIINAHIYVHLIIMLASRKCQLKVCFTISNTNNAQFIHQWAKQTLTDHPLHAKKLKNE